ncbi:MAG: hypothetical protein ISS26_00740 [Candidatus Omnitrophica bacterium]|nr:hypothetical protein [Candidatus Omnitrophota bacterium]
MEKIKKDNIITAISVHSSRVSACISALSKEEGLLVTGLGKSEGRLLGGKGVLDIDVLSRAIRKALRMAREESGSEGQKAFISVSGGNIFSEKSRGIAKLNLRGEEITDKNIKDALKVANTMPINIEKEIIHSIPQDFVVDGQSDIENPVGLYGVKLEIEALLVMAHVPFLQNIVKAMNLAGIDMEDIVFSGIASSKCLLSAETEKKGVILLEIDNSYTSGCLFYDNLLRGTAVVEKSVIQDGVLEELKSKLDKIRRDKTVSKIYLTGGGFIHEDFVEKVNLIFGIPSETSYVRNAKGRARDIKNTSHLTSIGLALYGAERRLEGLTRRKGRPRILQKISRSVGDFISDYF